MVSSGGFIAEPQVMVDCRAELLSVAYSVHMASLNAQPAVVLRTKRRTLKGDDRAGSITLLPSQPRIFGAPSVVSVAAADGLI